jgi:hypothetical protein
MEPWWWSSIRCFCLTAYELMRKHGSPIPDCGWRDEAVPRRVGNADHGLHPVGVLRCPDRPPAVALVTCPYCVLPVIDGQAAVSRGDFLAHAGCQARREYAGVYLTASGTMVVRTSGLNPVETACVIEMVARTKRKGRQEGTDELAAVEPARGVRVLGAAGG